MALTLQQTDMIHFSFFQTELHEGKWMVGMHTIVVSCRRAAVFSSLVPEGSRVCMCLCVVS